MGRWFRTIFWLLLLLQARLSLQATGWNPADVLLDFANAARGNNQEALSDWRRSTDLCTWTGVTCDSTVVTALRLPRVGLRGSLSPELAQLTSLQQINLAGNVLTGRLPARWSQLSSLERLFLDSNQLTGPLPPAWNTLESIQYLSLSGNALNGSLPVAWSSMGHLFLMDLSNNKLTGSLPAAWARQRMLVRLALVRNALSGSLPREWKELQGLLQLDLAGNLLTGSLPPDWGFFQQATSLDLSGNRLSGGLPPAWARMGSLQVLSLQGNQLTGAVPTEWAALADRAYRIGLGDNEELCGFVPPQLAQAVLAAGSSKKGSGLAASCSWEGDAAALLAFKGGVAAQQVHGGLADWLPQANPCAADAWAGVSCRGGRVVMLNLADAGLRVSSLEPLGYLTKLEKVVLAGNNAPNASLPASWAGLRHLSAVDLSNTGVSGGLPPSWADIRSLKQLLLRGNRLNGTLPAGWAALSNLAVLNLAQNALTGSLPPQWGALSSLDSLEASGNYLSGPLPEGWKELSGLEELHLASNNLEGAIPASWTHMPSLIALNLGSNVGICGGQPAWRAGTRVHTEATNIDQSCIMVHTSGTLAGVVLGVCLSLTLASLAAVGTMVVYVRRQRIQLQLLQRERSVGFSSMHGAAPESMGGKLATLHTFSLAATATAAEHKAPAARGERVKPLTIPNSWHEKHAGYIQVPMVTPHGRLAPSMPAATTPRSAPIHEQEHRSPSPGSGMPSPERHQWQVAAHAADRGVDLTARRSRQKRLFRSRSEAPGALADTVAWTPKGQKDQRQQREETDAARWSQETELDVLRVHSRLALLPSDGGMV